MRRGIVSIAATNGVFIAVDHTGRVWELKIWTDCLDKRRWDWIEVPEPPPLPDVKPVDLGPG